MRNFLAGFAACAVAFCAGGYAVASRNSAGTMSLFTPGNPVTSGTSISSSWANNTLSDFASEITDSLSRSGKGGMLAALRGVDGTVSSPAVSFTNEPVSGFYRIGANDLGLAVNGALKHEWTSTGETTTGTSTVSGALTIGSLFTQTISGSASTVASAILEPSLSNGNFLQLSLGRTTGVNDFGAIGFIPNATAALSSICLAINGAGPSSFCVDGNSKATLAGALSVAGAATLSGGGKIGSSGTVIANLTTGNCLLNGSTPATCTASVPTGSNCVCTMRSAIGTPHIISCDVTSTTMTAISNVASDTNTVIWICLA